MTPRTPKPYELMFENRDGYLYTRVKAKKMDRTTALEYLSDVAAECARVRCKRMLLDRDIPTPIFDPPHSGMQEFISYSRNIKIAIVGRPKSAASIKEAVELGALRGVEVAYFDTRREAEQWLLRSNGPTNH